MALVQFDGQLDSSAQAAGSKLQPFTGELDKPDAPQAQSTFDQFKRQLGLTGRILATGPTALGGAIADFGHGAAQLATGKNLGPRPSEGYQKLLTQLGLPEPNGTLENIVQAGGGMLAGAMDPALMGIQKAVGKMVPEGFKGVTAAREQVVKELHDAGIKLEPAQMEAGATMRGAQKVAGDARLDQDLQVFNQPKIQELAAKEVGLRPSQLTREALDQQAAELVAKGYTPIRDIPGKITVGRIYRDDLDKIAQKYHPKSFANESTPKLVEELNSLRVGGFPPGEALDKIQSLRAAAKDQFAPGGDSNFGRALREMAGALERQLERNLPPEMVPNFKEARIGLAKNNALKDMLLDPNTGTVDSMKAFKMLDDGEPLTGGLRTIAKAGSPDFARATRPPIRGESSPIGLGIGEAGAVGAAPFTGGASLLAIPGMAGARGLASKTVMSQAAQDAMMRRMMEQGGLFSPMQQRMMPAAAGLFGGSVEDMLPTYSQ